MFKEISNKGREKLSLGKKEILQELSLKEEEI